MPGVQASVPLQWTGNSIADPDLKSAVIYQDPNLDVDDPSDPFGRLNFSVGTLDEVQELMKKLDAQGPGQTVVQGDTTWQVFERNIESIKGAERLAVTYKGDRAYLVILRTGRNDGVSLMRKLWEPILTSFVVSKTQNP